MIARAVKLCQVCSQFIFILFYFILLLQAIDIFISRHPEVADYRLSTEDWAQIETFEKILAVLYAVFLSLLLLIFV